jgi:hypothetical protein
VPLFAVTLIAGDTTLALFHRLFPLRPKLRPAGRYRCRVAHLEYVKKKPCSQRESRAERK